MLIRAVPETVLGGRWLEIVSVPDRQDKLLFHLPTPQAVLHLQHPYTMCLPPPDPCGKVYSQNPPLIGTKLGAWTVSGTALRSYCVCRGEVTLCDCSHGGGSAWFISVVLSTEGPGSTCAGVCQRPQGISQLVRKELLTVMQLPEIVAIKTNLLGVSYMTIWLNY